ncbi:unnamed protein product [Didymodactylos carnosus]|uniref:Uncharacterized protein n=1 Tax=Didymodactylos carnosus TaxID=1234261 RepID=A0A8S2FWS0_9BILA|nr:unnamed protein product [Didymodactylos carnosus]CAF4369538.1 unnamed protein product [Didymodactylos carnosus]
MLGYGIYFARSINNTLLKARFGGAIICAQVRMENVLEVTKNELHNVSNSKQWWNTYDTVYYNHESPNKDEFCINDPEQVLC